MFIEINVKIEFRAPKLVYKDKVRSLTHAF